MSAEEIKKIIEESGLTVIPQSAEQIGDDEVVMNFVCYDPYCQVGGSCSNLCTSSCSSAQIYCRW